MGNFAGLSKFTGIKRIALLRRIKKILIIAIAGIVVLSVISVSLLYTYRDEIISMFVRKANHYINTPIEVERIDLEVLKDFPLATLEMNHIKVHESGDIVHDYLCTADQIGLSFDVLAILFKSYKIRTFKITNGVVNLGIDEQGEKNYEIFTRSKKPGNDSLPDVSVQQIELVNTRVNFQDHSSGVDLSLHTTRLDNSMKLRGKRILIHSRGDVYNDSLIINGTNYLNGQMIGLSSRFTYDVVSRQIDFSNTEMKINEHTYLINGTIKTGEERYMDLDIISGSNDLQAIVALLPRVSRSKLEKYRSSGPIDFSGKITGNYGHNQVPDISFNFKCDNVRFYYPGYKKSIDNLTFTGKFNNGSEHNLKSSILEIKDFSGYIDRHRLQGNLKINDLDRLNTDLRMSGDIDLDAFLKTFPVSQIRSGKGQLQFNIRLTGQLKSLKNKNAGNVRATGNVNLDNISMVTRYSYLPFENLNGELYFNNLDLGIRNFSGKIGASDVMIDGFFKNIIPYVLYKNKPIRIDADLNAHFLDLNELLTLDFSDPGSPDQDNEKYHFGIYPKLDINFDCRVDHAVLKRFSGKKISGKLKIHNQIAVVENAAVSTMGGKLLLSGSIVSREPDMREFLVDGDLNALNIDSIFYVFNNFRQQFLVDKNLRGKINAEVNTYFKMDKNLKFYPATLYSDIETSITGGQLIDFKPIQRLSVYLKNEDLTNVKFSDLRNDIQIADRKVIIPEMEIISSAYEIHVSGTHTFDQNILYHFRIPLDQFHRPDRDTRFGEIEDTGSGPPNLFLKMFGTANDYKVVYDTKAVAGKIKQDLKKEGEEFKSLFKKDTLPDHQMQLEKDEYFDFNDN